MEEPQVGITEYTTTTSGFRGILKHRYEDFLVFEVDGKGRTAHLTTLEPPEVRWLLVEWCTLVLRRLPRCCAHLALLLAVPPPPRGCVSQLLPAVVTDPHAYSSSHTRVCPFLSFSALLASVAAR